MRSFLSACLILVLSGCGSKGGSGSTSPAPGGATTGPAKNSYSFIVLGSNQGLPTPSTQFVTNTFDIDLGYADHIQYPAAPTTIPATQQFEYDFTAYNCKNLAFQVMNLNGSWGMTAKLVRNGVTVETTTLNANNDIHAFANW